ncbi:phosphoglycerate dehydrogenase [Priestia sp. 179-F W1.4 NHS]|uniref:phosphoglycerate dehydrogenase n=1 Tax=Priestia sp. 179-F W1.4 NHS TaxID=3374296 RepID=UPI00387A803D
MKVVSTSPSFAKYSNEPIDLLTKNGIELIQLPADISEDQFLDHIQDAAGAIVAFNHINQHVLSKAPHLKIICKHGIGVDNIDLKATNEQDVWVTNVPDANKHAVADFTFALMLSLARQVPLAHQQTKEGNWPRIFGSDIHNQTIGIVGLGSIGREVAHRAKGFSMEILAYDPYPNYDFANANGIKFVELDELLRNSDFVTLHMPLTKQTKNLIDSEQLEIMKESAYLINASRGEIVVEKSLYKALKSNTIAGAALDVFEKEPAQEHPLFDLPNFIATPHIAGYTIGAINSLGMVCAQNIVDVIINKKRPQHVVNKL